MKNLQSFFEESIDFECYPLARPLVAVLTSTTGVSPRGYPYFQEASYRLLRDEVPHILGMGFKTIQCMEFMIELVSSNESEFSKDTLDHFRRASEVVRAVVRTAAITAPSDLWLLHHVLLCLKHHGLLEELLEGSSFELSNVEGKGFLANEVAVDLSFLLSRGIVTEEADSFALSDKRGVRELVAGISELVPAGGVRMSELWRQAFREPSQFKQWDVLKEVVATIPKRKTIAQDSWAPTLEEVELGYRLLPLVLGLHASGVSPLVLQSGLYFVTDSSEVPMEVFHGAAAILEAAGVIVPQEKALHWDLTWVGKRVLERGIGPFGIIEAYHNYMINLPQIWREGRQRVSVSRGTNIAASQLANARSFQKANDAIDKFCMATKFEPMVFIEHALGRGEATRQRYERLKEEGRAEECSFIGADLEDPAIDAAMEEQRSGNLPSWMKFVRRADIGKPGQLVDALEKWEILSQGAFMVVGNGFHEVRNQTDESITAVFKGYQDAGIIIVFTEESALTNDDLLETAWNTYHSGFRYVHERSGQVLRPAETFEGIPNTRSYRSSWASCAEEAGYVRLMDYCSRSRTIFPYMPKNGRNPAISVNHFLVPRKLAKKLGLLSS